MLCLRVAQVLGSPPDLPQTWGSGPMPAGGAGGRRYRRRATVYGAETVALMRSVAAKASFSA
jgi:hypothetical protein